MIEQETICPYTGLRSFTEEESLYFKGRELQVDQITALLQQNKFLMVTGASGEGKSSLIYAGLIPNARAGFFKAKYTNWVVADFRPARTPVDNMAQSLAGKLNVKTSTVKTELHRGFSSLVDLYINSSLYVDETTPEWQSLTDPAKVAKKREAANLIILVDQFEEFFTNPENFFNEAPSQDSQVVVNILLETARIAIKRNLPIYVICTMRSDYIGQCSAFRGLPEYIGFSQFFVPRLKRKDLKQVIEEPALLSGNRISQRLIERLLYDLSEGVDQLPILQHALSQIWLAADHGRSEMDLIHYAMVGGMPSAELPDEDQKKYTDWIDTLPDHQKKYYQQTGLKRVIEIHASTLYETAWERYNRAHPDAPISQQEGKRIVALTFSCLTKIDNSRAVRNRMTLLEICGIINTDALTPQVVGDVISIYREDGNSFIRPFRTEDPESHQLSPDVVLDITHESLIRNWDKLNTWAIQEFEFYSTFLDFKKQLDRWEESGKSSDFLLPIGPLTYFENWYDSCKPNAQWIKRYNEVKGDKEDSLADSERILTNTQNFLWQSARKVVITRTFTKYGPGRIATMFAIILMAVLSGFYWIDAEEKQNDRVIERVRNQSFALMKSKEVRVDYKAIQLLLEERYEAGSIVPYLSQLEATTRLSLANESYKQLLLFNKHDQSEVKEELIELIYSNVVELVDRADPVLLLNEVNRFSSLLSYDTYYNPSVKNQERFKVAVDEGYKLVEKFYSNKTLFHSTVSTELNYAIQQWLTFGNVTNEKVARLLDLLLDEKTLAFQTYYPKGSYEINGRIANDFSGGHHTVSSLYAAMGDVEMVVKTFEAIKQSGQDDYFIGSLFNNYNHILGVLYQFNHRDKVKPMITWLSRNYESDTPLTIYRNAVIRAGYMSHFYRVNIEKELLRTYRGYFFPNLCLANREVFEALVDDYEKLIMQIPNPDERNYSLAINKKRRVAFTSKYNFDRGIENDTTKLEQSLKIAVDHYQAVDKSFLEEDIPITLPYFGDGVRSRNYKRKNLFIYPDYFEGWFSWTFHTDFVFNYFWKNDLFNTLYTSQDDFAMLHFWLAKAHEIKPYIAEAAFDNYFKLSDATLKNILTMVDNHPHGSGFDKNLMSLLLANRSFDTGDVEQGMKYYQLFDRENFASSRDRYEYIEKSFFLNQMRLLCMHLVRENKFAEAKDIAERFELEHEKAFAYIFMGEEAFKSNANPIVFEYLDSVFSKAESIEFATFSYGANQAIDPRFNLILMMSKIGGKQLNVLSDEVLSGILEDNKFKGVLAQVYGVAEEGNFYRALTSIPSSLTENEDLLTRAYILWQACRKKEEIKESNKWSAMDRFIMYDINYIWYLPR